MLSSFYLHFLTFVCNCALTAMQSQIVCAGCRSTLLYSMGATNVRCAICNTITLVSQPPTQSTGLIIIPCVFALFDMKMKMTIQI